MWLRWWHGDEPTMQRQRHGLQAYKWCAGEGFGNEDTRAADLTRGSQKGTANGTTMCCSANRCRLRDDQ